MSILYIPVLKKEGESLFDTALPSPLFGRLSKEDWEEIVHQMNRFLSIRRERLVFRLLSPLVIGNVMRSVLHSFVDRKVKAYLDRKNLILSHSGIYIYHPSDRMYSGMDLSIQAIAQESP